MVKVGERAQELIGAGRYDALRRLVRWTTRSYIVVIVVGIVVGLQVAPAVSSLATDPVTGTVAVITLGGTIDGSNAASVTQRLHEARQDPSVKAVVLLVNSGGGGAASSETIYLAVKRTAEEMPVVASVDSIAASGAYYSAVGADYIYAKPASLVGSVGVIFTAPTDFAPIDQIVTTGPNKLNSGDRRDWYYGIEAARRAFAGAVVESRGDRLEISEAELSYAKLYAGSQAVDMGMADRVGGLDDAIARAADLAGLSRFDVEIRDYRGTVSYLTRTAYVSSRTDDKELVSPTYLVERPSDATVPNLLMVPPSVANAAINDYAGNITAVRAAEVSANGTASAG